MTKYCAYCHWPLTHGHEIKCKFHTPAGFDGSGERAGEPGGGGGNGTRGITHPLIKQISANDNGVYALTDNGTVLFCPNTDQKWIWLNQF